MPLYGYQLVHAGVRLSGRAAAVDGSRYGVALLRLAGSLEERGVIEPVIVRPLRPGRFELVAGERRWRAALLIDLDTIPAVVRDLDDDLAFEVSVIENMARDDTTPMCARRGLTKAEVARRVGRSRAVISGLVRLLELPDEAQHLINEGRSSFPRPFDAAFGETMTFQYSGVANGTLRTIRGSGGIDHVVELSTSACGAERSSRRPRPNPPPAAAHACPMNTIPTAPPGTPSRLATFTQYGLSI